jgi:hypothetical protein
VRLWVATAIIAAPCLVSIYAFAQTGFLGGIGAGQNIGGIGGGGIGGGTFSGTVGTAPAPPVGCSNQLVFDYSNSCALIAQGWGQ